MPAGAPRSLLIVAGGGCYPRLLAAGARLAGVRRVVVLGFRGTWDGELGNLADSVTRIPFGSLARLLDVARTSGCEAAVMGGQIRPLNLFRARFDAVARDELGRMPVRNAHTLFGRLAELLTDAGLSVLPASFFMRGHLAGSGVLTRRAPDARERGDLQIGFGVALGVGNLDIGQTIVVKDGAVLAVEAFEGTDAAIRRGARLGGRGAVVIKVAKAGHDMRFDIPVIGMRTLTVLRRARVAALGIQTGRVLLLEQPRVLAAADRLGIAIEAVESGLPHAPVLPDAPP